MALRDAGFKDVGWPTGEEKEAVQAESQERRSCDSQSGWTRGMRTSPHRRATVALKTAACVHGQDPPEVQSRPSTCELPGRDTGASSVHHMSLPLADQDPEILGSRLRVLPPAPVESSNEGAGDAQAPRSWCMRGRHLPPCAAPSATPREETAPDRFSHDMCPCGLSLRLLKFSGSCLMLVPAQFS